MEVGLKINNTDMRLQGIWWDHRIFDMIYLLSETISQVCEREIVSMTQTGIFSLLLNLYSFLLAEEISGMVGLSVSLLSGLEHRMYHEHEDQLLQLQQTLELFSGKFRVRLIHSILRITLLLRFSM